MHKLTELIKNDMRPALGVTEPGAIAYAVSMAKKHTEGEVAEVLVALNSGMYKNAFTCGIPNSNEVGNVFSAALGVVAGNPDKGLESLEAVTEEDNVRAQKLVHAGKIKVELDHIGSEITIDATVKTVKDECTVRIAGGHTDIYQIVKNGEVMFEKERKAASQEEQEAVIHKYSFAELLSYADEVDVEEIGFIRDAFVMNMELLNEGLKSDKTTFGPLLKKNNGDKLFSEDDLKTAQLLCNGAIEARVLGLGRPAMSITGSGAHGIIATLPLYAYQQLHQEEVSEAMLLKATALSYLITMYIKEYSGKLSAFCGCGIAAGTGMACGLCYMKGGKVEEMSRVICNMASGLTGMICDGGNQGCTMKGIVAVDAAFRAVDMAVAGVSIDAVHGINGRTPEETMRNMGRIASPGMTATEKTIVEIMQEK
ncbi:MAG: serine dehydratase subunit alpha family protein [Tyzzerella sp.]|nr:serine dehydratase subunit alpha family protein [Tyzzerella sp.]